MLIFKKLKIAYEDKKGSETDLRSVLINALYGDMVGMYYLLRDKSKNNLRVLLDNDFDFIHFGLDFLIDLENYLIEKIKILDSTKNNI